MKQGELEGPTLVLKDYFQAGLIWMGYRGMKLEKFRFLSLEKMSRLGLAANN